MPIYSYVLFSSSFNILNYWLSDSMVRALDLRIDGRESAIVKVIIMQLITHVSHSQSEESHVLVVTNQRLQSSVFTSRWKVTRQDRSDTMSGGRLLQTGYGM